MIGAGVGSAAWLVINGQAGTVDGLFLVLTALVVAAAFGLYAVYMIRRAMEPAQKPAVKAAQAGAKATVSKAAPVSQTADV
jgi:hypothetical protein